VRHISEIQHGTPLGLGRSVLLRKLLLDCAFRYFVNSLHIAGAASTHAFGIMSLELRLLLISALGWGVMGVNIRKK
jgi:hypothetical protein